MSEKKYTTTDMLIGELFIAITAMKNILIEKKICTYDDLLNEIDRVASKLTTNEPELNQSKSLELKVSTKKVTGLN